MLFRRSYKDAAGHGGDLKQQSRHRVVSLAYIIKGFVLITLGIFSAAFGLKSFLLPTGFVDGGITGISLLVNKVTGLPLSLVLVCINIPFILFAYSQVGKRFAVRSIVSIVGLALVLAAVPFPMITSDKLLVSVFGGFFLGAGIGLSMRGGAVLDGTEILAIYTSRKLGLTIGDVIIVFNVIIFLSAIAVLKIEYALYSMVTYFIASKTVDFIVEGVEEYIGVTIISSKHEAIRKMIIEQLGRGVTIYPATGGYGTHGHTKNYSVVYTIITRLEIVRLRKEIDEIDANAFMVMTSVRDIKGGMIKKRSLK
ncbi:MAG: YitT family protein [Flavobacteriales bacterium]